MSSHLKKNIVALFNSVDMIPNNKYAADIANELGLTYDIAKEEWSCTTEPRFIKALGKTCYKALEDFLRVYKKGYRRNKIADEFYKLSDEEIVDLFIELPFYMKTVRDPQYQITAEKFLAERIWQTEYPFKPKGVRKREFNITAQDWDSYLATIPESQKESLTVYREQGMSFQDFRSRMMADA